MQPGVGSLMIYDDDNSVALFAVYTRDGALLTMQKVKYKGCLKLTAVTFKLCQTADSVVLSVTPNAQKRRRA